VNLIPNSDPAVVAMKRATEVGAVLKIRLANLRSFYPDGPVVAVEGDIDKVVYSHWINRCDPNAHFEFFVCNGKRNAKQLCIVLARDLTGLADQISFIVDRDFDDLDGFPDNANVMMLDRYSFENYLVEDDVLEQILRLGFPCNGYPDLRNSIKELFLRDYDDFLRLSAPVNYLIFVGRRLKMDIDDIIPKGIAELARLELGNIEGSGRNPYHLVPLPREVDAEESVRLTKEFGTLSGKERYRGKYSLKFFRGWLDLLVAELKNGKKGLFASLESVDRKILNDELSVGAMARSSAMPLSMAEFVQRLVPRTDDGIGTI